MHLQIITQEPRQDRECLLPSAFHPRGDLDARTSGVSPPSGCVGSCPAGQKTPVVKPSALLELSLSPYLSIDIRAPTLIFPWLTGHPVGRQKRVASRPPARRYSKGTDRSPEASDSLIPVEHSKTLFGVCRSRKLLVTPAKMDHNSSMFSDPPHGRRGLRGDGIHRRFDTLAWWPPSGPTKGGKAASPAHSGMMLRSLQWKALNSWATCHLHIFP